MSKLGFELAFTKSSNSFCSNLSCDLSKAQDSFDSKRTFFGPAVLVKVNVEVSFSRTSKNYEIMLDIP